MRKLLHHNVPVLPSPERAARALIRITNLIVKLTPYGVFAITASAAGTMTIEEFGRLQVYLVSFNVGAVFMTFWVLPMLLAPATPFKYRDIMGLDAEPKHPRWSIVRNVLGWVE